MYDGPLDRVNAELNSLKTVRLTLSSLVSDSALSSFAGFSGSEGDQVLFRVAREDVRVFSRNILDELPVVDFTVEDTPLEEGIERLYRSEAYSAR